MDNQNTEKDSTFFLKILLFMILGLIWLYFPDSKFLGFFRGVPVGLLIGVLFASHDHFQIDRKLEYVVLLIATVLGYLFPLISLQVSF